MNARDRSLRPRNSVDARAVRRFRVRERHGRGGALEIGCLMSRDYSVMRFDRARPRAPVRGPSPAGQDVEPCSRPRRPPASRRIVSARGRPRAGSDQAQATESYAPSAEAPSSSARVRDRTDADGALRVPAAADDRDVAQIFAPPIPYPHGFALADFTDSRSSSSSSRRVRSRRRARRSAIRGQVEGAGRRWSRLELHEAAPRRTDDLPMDPRSRSSTAVRAFFFAETARTLVLYLGRRR